LVNGFLEEYTLLTREAYPVWSPSKDRISASNLTAFQRHLGFENFATQDERYQSLHTWSCQDPDGFWRSVADFCGVSFGQRATNAFVAGEDFLSARWFSGATLNYAENLLKTKGADVAVIAHREGAERVALSWDDLREQTAAVSSFLREQGVQPGQRVAAIMPNVAETVIAMLAVSSIGAVWSSCSPDFGSGGILDRFSQIEPVWLFAANGYQYNGKQIDSTLMVAEVVDALPSLEGVISTPVLSDAPPARYAKPTYQIGELLTSHKGRELRFSHLPFDHPLVIAYSSGTTGLPKPIIHRAGGVLLQHLKEHQIQTDIKAGDRFFFFTTCGWMMWNWLVSGLASGATLVLYDGSPFADQGHVLLDLIERESLRVFGVGAKYLQTLQKQGLSPKQGRDLSSLDTLLSTGSPLTDESYDFVYTHFKSDIHLASISGGTDILSCFVGGAPNLPVRRGEIQAPGLGMDVQIWSNEGKQVFDEQGELVCCSPFPTVPLGFWGDDSGERVHKAYFSEFEGVWCQSDFSVQYAHGGIRILGRSDSVLNPGGVRIGTAEIYRQVDTVLGVMDSVVVGLPFNDDVQIILFVVMAENEALTTEVEETLRFAIRDGATPRHVPKLIINAPDIPRTLSGKVAEKAVLNTLQGEVVTNSDALANAESLRFFAAQRQRIIDQLSQT
jgi:acetoacetyl-CoA synthetase